MTETTVEFVIKRDGSNEPFDLQKITNAVGRAMKSIKIRSKNIAKEVAEETASRLGERVMEVDVIHRTVENVIMDMGLHDLAREYIVYRHNHMPDIFRKRTNLKPYEYPHLAEFVEAIRHSYWVHTEFNYSPDIQDLKVKMTPQEADIAKRAMLAISQIEVKVKEFWGKIGDRLEKPEVKSVGYTFADSEVRHMDAYSHLIELMGLNEEFKEIMEVPAIRKRVEYMENTMAAPVDNKDYFYQIILFSMFVENVSLFSQFLILMSFNKHQNMLKGISNAVEATSKEEDIHARFGFELVKIIKDENPDWWTKDAINQINRMCREAYKAEATIIDWIYGEIDLDHTPKETVKEFIKDRFNQSLVAIDLKPIYDVDEKAIEDTRWFSEEMDTTKNVDFFNKRSTAYSKKAKAFTADELF